MKKKLAALLAVCLTLCSCSVYEDEISIDTPAGLQYNDTPEDSGSDKNDTNDKTPSADLGDSTPSVPDDAPALTSPPDTDGNALQTQADEAVQQKEAAPAETKPAETAPAVTSAPEKKEKRLAVPFYSQQDYPTGCELVCASMLLAYYGYNIAPIDLINAGYVGTGSVHEDFMNPGTFYGSDPNKVFIGDPNSIYNYSYGCYSGAILAGFEKYFAKEMVDVADISGMSLADLCTEYIDWDQPVLIWASNNMEAPHREENNKWFIEETGELFEWMSNEHCLVLVGYDDENYCFHDPIKGAYTLYPKALSEQRYRELGCQAITVHPWE